MARKLIALCLMLVLALGSLTACGDNTGQPNINAPAGDEDNDNTGGNVEGGEEDDDD